MEQSIKLIEQLPKRFGASQKITDRLNNKGISTSYGRKYTVQNVRNALNNIHTDDNVILELVQLVKEYKATKQAISRKIESVLA